MFDYNSRLSYPISRNDFDKVKQLIEEEGKDPNALDTETQMRPIFLAAIRCNREIFHYLLVQGASISSQGQTELQNNLLFCILARYGKNKTERNQLLLWLREENRYEQLELGIQKEHMAAALGELPQERNLGERDKCGLLPSHYAAMVGSPNYLAWCSETCELEEDGEKSQGITVSWLLGINRLYGGGYLFKYADHCQAINFNSVPFLARYFKIMKKDVFDTIQLDSMTLTWHLVDDGMTTNFLEWYLDKKPLTKISLETYYDHEVLGIFSGTLSLIERLLLLHKNVRETLLEKIFRAYTEEEIKQLANLFLGKQGQIDYYTGNPKYNVYDYCQLALARKSYRELYQRLSVQTQEKSSEKETEKSISKNNETALSKEEIQNYFNKIFNYLHSINPNSPHYPQAQSIIGNIISSHIQERVLQPLLWTALASHAETTLNYPTKIENQLRLYMIICFNRGDEENKLLSIQMREDFYEEKQPLNQENKRLKREAQELKRKLLSLGEEETHETSAVVQDEKKTSDISISTVIESEKETSENSATVQSTVLPVSNTLDVEFEKTISHKTKMSLSEETFDKLFELIDLDKFQELKELLEKENIKPGIKIAKITGEMEDFVINIAAATGSFAIIQYLFDIRAFPTEPERAIDNFLFAACMCEDKEKQQAILQWLLEDNRYEHFNLGLQKEHIAAALGESLPEGYVAKRDKNGLLPCHYAAMIGSKNLLAWCSETGKVEEDGELTHGIRVSLLLATMGHFELLASYLQKYLTSIDPNATSLEFPFQGESFLLLVADAQEWELYDVLAERYAEIIDWNATALNGPLAGLNVFWLLAFYERWEALNQWAKYARTINWDAVPVNGFYAPSNFSNTIKENNITEQDIYKAVCFLDEPEIDEFNQSVYEKILIDSFDEIVIRPIEDFYNNGYKPFKINHIGLTFAWLLIRSQQFNFIIENLRKDPDATINLFAGPIDASGQSSGVIVLMHLIDLKQWPLLHVCFARKSFIDLEILLTEQSSAGNNFSKTFILDCLIQDQQYSLVILIIQSLNEEEIQKLANFYREIPNDDNSILCREINTNIIVDACQLALAIKCHEQLSHCVLIQDQNESKEKEKNLDKVASNQMTEEDKRMYLTDIFDRLYSVEIHSVYYRQAQSQIGHIIFSYLGEPELLWSVLAIKIKEGYKLTEKNYTFKESTTIETQLRLYMEICLAQGDDESKNLVVRLIAEVFERCEKFPEENAALQLEIDELKSLIESKVISLPSLSSVEYALLWQPTPNNPPILDQSQNPRPHVTGNLIT